jgi:prepilin-type N-terminal cleavage/methylation domain-containing protein
MRRLWDRKSFTLIEMLVVVVIIAILTGMVFKLLSYAKNAQMRAACVAKLERIAHALNEYKAEYGQYPPVGMNACRMGSDRLCLEWWGVRCHRTDCRTCYVHEDAYSDDRMVPVLKYSYYPRNPANTNILRFGLVSYLIPRLIGEGGDTRMNSAQIVHTNLYIWTNDTPRDLIAKKRWAPFLEDQIEGWNGGKNDRAIPVTNYFEAGIYIGYDGLRASTILDPWHWVVRYRSDPPYQTYDLYSPGPNGVDGDGDDIHRAGKWDE